MTLTISTQKATQTKPTPSLKQLREWCEFTLKKQKIKNGELCIRIVDEKESASLNKQYRQKNGATNVLSFPAPPLPKGIPAELNPELGDLVICAAIVNQEAREQGKVRSAHWAHMVIHGTLHVLGFDHIKEAEAQTMEALEIKLLKQLGFSSPY